VHFIYVVVLRKRRAAINKATVHLANVASAFNNRDDVNLDSN